MSSSQPEHLTVPVQCINFQFWLSSRCYQLFQWVYKCLGRKYLNCFNWSLWMCICHIALSSTFLDHRDGNLREPGEDVCLRPTCRGCVRKMCSGDLSSPSSQVSCHPPWWGSLLRKKPGHLESSLHLVRQPWLDTGRLYFTPITKPGHSSFLAVRWFIFVFVFKKALATEWH